MDIALEHLQQAQAMMAQQHQQQQQQQQQQNRGGSSPSLSHSSPEPPTTPIVSRRPSLSAVHGAMLSHGHDIFSKFHKVSYSSPPPIACSPENNVCKLINYRNAKIAAFNVDGRELICLPQAFELFLKHLVGGLHTVYTKLKRLDIVPVVCNVEQVRVLRGLGAIQPGVNRCKLISCKEFDVLYDDCTNSSARPGRPPKRSPSLHASPETIDKLKKSRFDGADYYNARFFDTTKNFLNGFPPNPYMSHLPFMQLNHPLLTPPVNLAMAQQFGLRPEGLRMRDPHHIDSDRMNDGDDQKERTSPKPSDHPFHPAYNTKPLKEPECDYKSDAPLNLHINGHAEDLRKSPAMRSDMTDDNEDIDDDNPSDDDKSAADSIDLMDTLSQTEVGETTQQSQHIPANMSNGTLSGYSSIETLLLNIQGLLKVAGENARQQERQIAELKSELFQEKKSKEEIEKQLLEEQRQKDMLYKRLKKERRARRQIEEHKDASDARLSHVPTKYECMSPSGANPAATNTDINKTKSTSPNEVDGSDRYGSSNNIHDPERSCPSNTSQPAFPTV